ncbi:MAG TPA: hypothetical protein VNU71_14620 [Burkholderiaceae bacterium]|nr:hypothetical protein [Burkholderiaceae bacterium]
MQQTVNLIAGARTRVEAPGASFVMVSTGAVPDVELWIMRGSQEVEYIRTAPRGFKARMGQAGFTHIELRAAAGTVCEVVISDGVVDFDFITGTTVQAQLLGLPIPVINDRGSPGNLLYVSGVSISDAPATSAPDNAAVACTAVQALILAADATRRQITFTNIGADPVALGATGITWAKRCIILASGDSYVEDRASNLAWYGICDAAKTASVTTKTVLA